MKSIFIFFLLTTSHFAYTQCIVNAGSDKYICVDKFGVLDSTVFDANILQGTPPYQIRWETEFLTGLQSIPKLTASNFLNDTTLLKPQIIESEIVSNNEPQMFYLYVKDSLGYIGVDSVQVIFSKFGLLADFLEREIVQGDTIELYPIVGRGIPPLSYEWFPDYNITDINAEYPRVWPDITTKYDVIVTDSVGCVSDWLATEWTIHVSPVNIDNIDYKSDVVLYPNPISDNSILDLSQQGIQRNLEILVCDNLGRVLLSEEIKNTTYPIGHKIKNAGIYHYQIYSNNKLVAKGKLLR